jgi:hypothetical protein
LSVIVLSLEPLKEYGVSEPFCKWWEASELMAGKYGFKIPTQLSLPSRGVEGGLWSTWRVCADGKLDNFPGGEKDMVERKEREGELRGWIRVKT